MKRYSSDPLRIECIAPDRTPEDLECLREELNRCRELFRDLAERHALLASETRLKILSLLGCAGELCVCDLATVLEMTPAAVSQHLSRLRTAGIVHARRDGMTIYYGLSSPEWSPLAPPPELTQPSRQPEEAS
ncbi:MAG: winged helix-turn-helix transcriptional regulator [Acidobacteria bacterium]|nr:winged helix-turn-helix transcriptional regulator [Acidobacteriota bacterium]